MVSMQDHKFNFHLLLHAAKLVEERVALHLAEVNIRPRQARILDALYRMGPTSQAKLAREFDISAASMSTMTNRLVSAGYISRTTDQNELRSNVLELSSQGEKLLMDINEAWACVDAEISETIGADKAAVLAQLVYELRDGLGGTVPWECAP
jgi:DNA-binding MarR family transcriptional regulator